MRASVQRQGDDAVAPVIAEVLLVAITVTISASLFLFANNLTTQSLPNRPFVVLSPARVEDGVAVITVTAASRGVPSTDYKVNLQVSSATGTPAGLPPSGRPAAVVVSGASYQITWTDVGGEGVLTQGDPITIAAASGLLPAGTACGFYLLWSDGSVVASVAWTT